MNIPKIIRLGPHISTGIVLKFLLLSKEDKEHAIHILLNGSIKEHSHPDAIGISEGYRMLNIKNFKFSDWKVVGAGMPAHSHKIPYKKELQIVEGCKRGSGIECWPELNRI